MKISLTGFLMLMMTTQAIAQQLKGKVTDRHNNPLIGVHVINLQLNRGTTTDIDGNFGVACSSGDTISFSFVGFLDRNIVTSEKTDQQVIVLFQDTYRLSDFVVHGDRIGVDVFGTPKAKEFAASVRLGSFLKDNPNLAPKHGFSRKSYNDKYEKQKKKLPQIIDQEKRLDAYYLLKENDQFREQLVKLYPKVNNQWDTIFAGFVQDYLKVIYSSSPDEVKAAFLLYVGEKCGS